MPGAFQDGLWDAEGEIAAKDPLPVAGLGFGLTRIARRKESQSTRQCAILVTAFHLQKGSSVSAGNQHGSAEFTGMLGRIMASVFTSDPSREL